MIVPLAAHTIATHCFRQMLVAIRQAFVINRKAATIFKVATILLLLAGTSSHSLLAASPSSTQQAPKPEQTQSGSADNKQTLNKSQNQSELFQSDFAESFWQSRQFILPKACPSLTQTSINGKHSTNEGSAFENHSIKSSSNTDDTRKDISPASLFVSDSANFRISAEQAKGIDRNTIELTGDVQMLSPTMRLAAGQLQFDQSNSDFTAHQDILLETDTALFAAETIEGNNQTQDAALNNSQYRIKNSGANGDARQITVSGAETLSLQQLSFSTCPAGDDSWRIHADELSLDTESGWGEADNMILTIADIPVLYLPWLKFPIDDQRHSGILPPTFSDNSRNGLDISVPVYWNIAPNYDATITPRYLEQRGTQLGAEFRYLSDHHQGQQTLAYLNDRQVENELQTSDPNQSLYPADANIDSTRWFYQVDHLSQFTEHWRFKVQAAGVSDRYYFQDLGTDLASSGAGFSDTNLQQLSRHGQLEYFSPQLQTSLSWLRYQPLTLQSEPYRQQPQWLLNWQATPAGQPLQWQLNTQYTQFESADPSALEAERSIAQSRLSYRLSAPWGYLEPAVKLHHARYQQTDPMQLNPKSDHSVNTTTSSLDSGLIFERALENGAQTIEPRLFLLHTPYQDQSDIGLFDTRLPDFRFSQLFRDNRFSGYDRIGDTEQASFAITSRLFSGPQQQEVLRYSIGRSYYFADRKVTLLPNDSIDTRQHSNILSELVWHPLEDLSVYADIGFNTERNETEQGNIGLSYEPNDDFMVNVSHRFNDSSSGYQEQSDIGFIVPMSDQWRLIGRWHYDLINKRSLETLAGFEYESCCWSIRIVSRRHLSARLDQNGGIIAGQSEPFNQDLLLQFVFKGIGGGGREQLKSLLTGSR